MSGPIWLGRRSNGRVLTPDEKEYWIIDRFRRPMTGVKLAPNGPVYEVIPDEGVYATPLLAGFELPDSQILARSGAWA